MAQNFDVDPLDPECQEGRHLSIGLMHDQIIAEARKAAEDGKRALSGGDSPRRSTKRSCHGRGKARGRRGGRAGRRSGLTTGMGTEVLALPAEDSLPSPRAQLNAQEIFEQNMERLSAILESCPYPAEPERSSASSWSVRQQKASDRWEEARPYHLRCLLESEAVGKPLCCFCHQPAVIRCRECLPEEWFCGACDVHYHSKRPLHNRDSVVDGLLKAISHPHASREERMDNVTHMSKTVRILPTVRVQHCTCHVPNFTSSAGKPAILITINGRYDLHLPLYVCQTCSQQWSPDVKDLVRSGYWPASASASTMYTVDLLNSFQELKVISPGFSRQAFAKLLEHRTQCAGRSGQINGDALQRSFLEFAYASFEKDQLCCDTPFTCPACTPEMVAVSADGNRKLYRFGHTGRSNDTPFFDWLFLAKDSEVSAFVNTIEMAVKNVSLCYTLTK